MNALGKILGHKDVDSAQILMQRLGHSCWEFKGRTNDHRPVSRMSLKCFPRASYKCWQWLQWCSKDLVLMVIPLFSKFIKSYLVPFVWYWRNTPRYGFCQQGFCNMEYPERVIKHYGVEEMACFSSEDKNGGWFWAEKIISWEEEAQG